MGRARRVVSSLVLLGLAGMAVVTGPGRGEQLGPVTAAQDA